MWSIQGVLYLYFGFLLSPIIVFMLAFAVGRNYLKIEFLIKSSPTLAIFVIFLLMTIIDNGTIERIFVVSVVRPVTTILLYIILVGFLQKFSYKELFSTVKSENIRL